MSKKAARFLSSSRDCSNHSAYGSAKERNLREAEALELEKVDGSVQLSEIGRRNFRIAHRRHTESLDRFARYADRFPKVADEVSKIRNEETNA